MPQLGLEFSGYNGREKVFGLVAEGALASSVTVSNDFIWNVPKNWSMEEAATVPFSYALVMNYLSTMQYILELNSLNFLRYIFFYSSFTGLLCVMRTWQLERKEFSFDCWSQ